MAVYTGSLSNLEHYKNDYYKVVVTIYLPYHFQGKIDTWINDVAHQESYLIGWNRNSYMGWIYRFIPRGNGLFPC